MSSDSENESTHSNQNADIEENEVDNETNGNSAENVDPEHEVTWEELVS